MVLVDYAKNARKRPWRKGLLVYCCLLAGVALVALAVLMISMHQGGTTQAASSASLGLRVVSTDKETHQFDAPHVFDDRVQPAITQLKSLDDAAVNRSIDRIHEHFENARNGAPAFAASIIGPLNSVEATYLAGEGMFRRWWYKDPTIQPVAAHVAANYAKYVTSGPKIRDAIVDSVEQLEQDFKANRNDMVQAVNANLRAADLPVHIEVDQSQLDEFCQQQFKAAIEKLNKDHVAEHEAADSTIAALLNAAVTSIVGESIAATITGTAAEAGGTVAAGTTGGGVLGSELPGAGNLIGAGAGFLAGVAVDMWISKRSQAACAQQVMNSLDAVERVIVDGNEKQPGIRKTLDDAAAQQVQQLGEQLRLRLTEAAK